MTWHNTIADFPFLSVGVTYLPIPVGGVCLLLFIIERIFLGAPPDPIAHCRSRRSTERWKGWPMEIFILLGTMIVVLPDRHADRLFAGDGGDRRRARRSAFRWKP